MKTPPPDHVTHWCNWWTANSMTQFPYIPGNVRNETHLNFCYYFAVKKQKARHKQKETKDANNAVLED